MPLTLLESFGYYHPKWFADANCKEHPEVEWHPGRGQSAAPAIAVCRQCLVVEPCLAWAMTDPQLFGVLGATSYKARRPRHASDRKEEPAA